MIIIYSGEVPELDVLLFERLGANHVLTIIPSNPADMASAKQVQGYFRQRGLRARLQSTRFYRVPKQLRQIIINSDAVYLMGGNTFEFLAFAHRVGLFMMLSEFEAQGGIILSESAGSIILSPTIATALIPTTCPDEQTVELNSYAGMSRLPFHVSPHFDPRAAHAAQELEQLQALADVSRQAVMVLQDGEGLVVQQQQVSNTIGQPQMLSPSVLDWPESDRSVTTVEFLPPWVINPQQTG